MRFFLVSFLIFVFTQLLSAQGNTARYSTQIFRNWVSFSGTSGNYIRFENNNNWKPEPDLTLETWIRLNENAPSTFQHISGNCWAQNQGLDMNWGIGFALINNRIGFHLVIKGNPTTQIEVSNPNDTLSECKWYHLAGVKRGQTAFLYVNGELRAQKTLPAGFLRTSNGYATIGTNYASGFNNWFNGNIDEFRLWNFAKTQAQIQQKMNDTLIGNEQGLNAYYKMNEIGGGPSIIVKNSALTGALMNGLTYGTDVKFTNTEVLPVPSSPTVIPKTLVCNKGSVLLNASSSLSPGSASFQWLKLPNDSLILGANSATFNTPVISKSDSFYVFVTDKKSKCTSPSSLSEVTIVAKPIKPILTIKPDSFCASQPIQLNTTPVSGSFSYFWFRSSFGNQPWQNTLTPSVSVPNPGLNELFKVVYSSVDFFCPSDTSQARVFLLPEPKAPSLDIDKDSICNSVSVRLKTNQITGNVSYSWFRSSLGNQIWQTTIVPEIQVINPVINEKFRVTYRNLSTLCSSDTASITIYKKTFKNPLIENVPKSLCLGGKGMISLSGLKGLSAFLYSDSSYKVLIDSTTKDTTIFTPSLTKNTRFYIRYSKNEYGCQGRDTSFSFLVSNRIKIDPNPNNPSLVCKSSKDSVSFSVIGNRNDTFKWIVDTSMAEIVKISPNNRATISWKQRKNQIISVTQINTGECLVDTLNIPITFDNSFLSLNEVSTQYSNDKNVELKYSAFNKSEIISPNIVRENSRISTLNLESSNFIDTNLNTKFKIYRYKLNWLDKCGIYNNSDSLETILLNVDQTNKEINLNWNQPERFFESSKTQIWDFNIKKDSYKLLYDNLSNTPVLNNFYEWIFDEEQNYPCFRIANFKFTDNGKYSSLSNVVCKEVPLEINIPNLISKNGDNKNDLFFIKYLKFFPDSEIEIHNRWGKKVFESKNYKNDWPNADVFAGLYFYRLKISKSTIYPERIFKGFVEIVD